MPFRSKSNLPLTPRRARAGVHAAPTQELAAYFRAKTKLKSRLDAARGAPRSIPDEQPLRRRIDPVEYPADRSRTRFAREAHRQLGVLDALIQRLQPGLEHLELCRDSFHLVLDRAGFLHVL